MIPYLEIPYLPGTTLSTFGFLVGLGFVAGYLTARLRAASYGVPLPILVELMLFVMIPGFLGSHVFEVIFYHPAALFSSTGPSLLWQFNRGISSFGGFLSVAVLFAAYWKLRRPSFSFGILSDILVQGFLVAWIFGRLGCSLAHDHPGFASDFFLAIDYPGGSRHDLGWYEFLFTLFILFPTSYAIHRARLAPGTQLIALLLLYSPIRFFFEFLRSNDIRYFGLTPAHYGSFILFGLGLKLAGKAIAESADSA